jgi:hypothetical protein
MTPQAAAKAETSDRHEQTVQPATVGIREQLDATTLVLARAHEAHVDEALNSVRWERRGPLRRLVRLPQS